MVARTRRARVTGIGGIFFKAKDSKALVQWYRRHLGIHIEDAVALFTWRGGRDGKAKGHTVWSIFPADTTYFGESGASFMVNYRVKDLDGVLGALRDEGVETVRKVEDTKYGRFGWIQTRRGIVSSSGSPRSVPRARESDADGVSPREVIGVQLEQSARGNVRREQHCARKIALPRAG